MAAWLLTAAEDRERARQEWDGHDVALLRCGGAFAAVRVPTTVVEAAARTNDRRMMGEYLDEALLGGAAFIDESFCRVYFLVPPSECDRWNVAGSTCLGPDTFLGVPYPGVEHHGRAYWLAEMDGPGALCTPDVVKQLVLNGRHRLTSLTCSLA
ncbi:hypothetical protein ADL00_40540 [Streptomyces sp. AS58]|nr:hypothetical protein ADL00_40540 [Streptomyces sp. AS58]